MMLSCTMSRQVRSAMVAEDPELLIFQSILLFRAVVPNLLLSKLYSLSDRYVGVCLVPNANCGRLS